MPCSLEKTLFFSPNHCLTQVIKNRNVECLKQKLVRHYKLWNPAKTLFLKSVEINGAFTLDANQREVCNLREWSLTSLAQNRPTIQNNFVYVKLTNRSRSLRLVKTFRKLSITSNFGCFASNVNFRAFSLHTICCFPLC